MNKVLFLLPRYLYGKKWDCLETREVCVCIFVSKIYS